jgi:hypothetical protein
MNLLEERDYYKPFNYPWAFEFYKKTTTNALAS